MFAFTDLPDNKIDDSTGEHECFPSFPCFLALIA
jgi:hypothetical protein